MRLMLVAILVAATSFAAPSDPAVADAAAHYQAGLKLYNLSEWNAALGEFKQAYLAKPDPVLLFNIGQCQRQLADYEGAENSYRAFLRESPELSASQESQVRALIVQMEDAIKEQRARLPPTGPNLPAAHPRPSPAPVAMVATPAPSKTPVYKKWWVWVPVAAVVAASVGIGLGVGLSSASERYPASSNPDATIKVP